MYHSPHKSSYMRRHDQVLAEVDDRFDVHVHTRCIRRLGLRDDMVVQISVKKNDHVTSVRHDEARAILRMFQVGFPEMGHVNYVLGNSR